MLLKSLLNLLTLVKTHQSVVDEDSVEAVTNCLLHELGSHCAINTTGDSSDDLGLVANKLPEPSDLLLDKVAHNPVRLRSTNVDTKVTQNLTSTGVVFELGAGLYAKDWLCLASNASKLGVGSLEND